MADTRLITLGCRLNAFESEVMRGHATAAGLADAIIVNTCAVTAEAERQARQTIRKARRENPEAKIIVTGCAAQISPEKYAALPEVDHVLGNSEKLEAGSFLRLAGNEPAERLQVSDIMAVRETAGHLISGFAERSRAFIEIQQGCDHRCTFCIIPFGRGNNRSVPVGEIVEQVRRLVANGVREVVLTGVDITGYGDDLPGRPRLGQLARRLLNLVPDLERLRLSSLDVVEVDDELLRLLAEEKRLMPHLHLSLQHGDDMVLKRMKRRHLRADAIRFCAEARRLPHRRRNHVPQLAFPDRGLRAHLPACLSLFGAVGHAGFAHAAGARRYPQGARGPVAGCRQAGFAPLFRRPDRRQGPRAGRARRCGLGLRA
jgi:threonylcarbamoyladenosine tRNA methylthiotransferase MtaB